MNKTENFFLKRKMLKIIWEETFSNECKAAYGMEVWANTFGREVYCKRLALE